MPIAGCSKRVRAEAREKAASGTRTHRTSERDDRALTKDDSFLAGLLDLSRVLAIQIVDFLLYLADFFGEVVHLSEIVAIGFDYQLLVILF